MKSKAVKTGEPVLRFYYIDVFIFLFPIIGLIAVIYDFTKQLRYGSKKAVVFNLVIITVALIVKYFLTSETPTGVGITPQMMPIMFYLIFAVCLFVLIRGAVKTFYVPNKRNRFYNIFFGASILWFISITKDLIFLIDHMYHNIPMGDNVIGGAGFNDGLFIYGATTFVMLFVFYVFWSIVMWGLAICKRDDFRKSLELLHI